MSATLSEDGDHRKKPQQHPLGLQIQGSLVLALSEPQDTLEFYRIIPFVIFFVPE